MKTNHFLVVIFLMSILCVANISCKKDSSPGSNEVFIQDNSYNPSSITVKSGTTVTWTNKGSGQHTVSSDGSGPLNSGTLNANQTYSFTTGTTGTYTYHCNFHSEMHGTLVVN
ncbi:MAG: Blue (Type 1) copper protein [Bacteroidota bacterium]|nr:Blue (Type 1) copper protein [Bacteroidota bacterium]